MIASCVLRYAFSKSGGHRFRVIRIIITLALSLAILSSVLSIMDFLQRSRFDDIRAVRSFDIVINGEHKEEMRELYPSLSVFLYAEGEALIDGSAYLLRYIDDDYDGGLRYLRGDSFSLSIPYALYRKERKTDYSVTMLKKGRSGIRLPKSTDYYASGIYSTPLGSEFDSSMLFLPLSEYDGSVIYTAIKGADEDEKAKLVNSGYIVRTWKESEASLYSAFVIEKAMMYSVLSLLFIIIAVSEKQSVRIFFNSKEKERAELCVLGVSRIRIGFIFIMAFMIIVMISIAASLVLSYMLLPVMELAISPFIYGEIELKMPVSGFAVFSSASLLITFIFALREVYLDRKKDLMEVIHG